MSAAAAELRTVGVLSRRALNEIVRVPGAAIPGVLAPTIFMLGLTASFGKLSALPGFSTNDYMSFLIPVSMMQGAGFTGAATGVNLARDIEQGWFDRLLVSPASRRALLAGTVASASVRALLPATVLMIVGLACGVHWPGISGLAIAIPIVMLVAALAACWGILLALRFKSQSAAPLMQSAMFMLVLFTPSYAPQELLTGWLHDVARVNPLSQTLEAIRQGFVGDITWHQTWQGFLAVAVLATAVALLAIRRMNRFAD